jgi:DUF4097 and DUF4098 domain-containing protein YvlB
MTIRQVLAHGAVLALVSTAPLTARITETRLDDQTPAAPRAAAGATAEKLVVPFSDPSRPGVLRVGLTTGTIKVTAHQGKEVVISTRTDDVEHAERVDRQGLRRIRNTSGGLTVEEERNEMRVSAANPNQKITLDIQVPTQTSLVLSTTNDGDIIVSGVSGDIEVNNTNGGVTLTGVSGTVVAHALNEDVVATMVAVGGKPMSFTSLNGDINVTLPSTVKADVRLQPGNGDVYSDFDIAMQAPVLRQDGGQRQGGGKYVLKVEQTMVGKINGGGPEITFKTFNGDIRIRKGA